MADQPRRWAFLLIFHAEVCLELARFDQCEADVKDVLQVGEELHDELLLAYGHWNLAISASHRREAGEALERSRRAETYKGDWWEPASADFLADAADNLDRVGHSALAVEYLLRARQNPLDAEPVLAMAEGALLARHGDPYRAEERLLAAPSHRIDPREYWRVTLLRAYAAFRRGDREAGALAARAFEEAARIGLAQLPLTKEGAITEELLGLAVETGQPAALALEATALPVFNLCADAAAGRGDLDETRRILELTIDLAPYDDERYLRAASALLEQDRRGAALTVVRRARTVLAELGLQPPPRLISLERAIVA